MKQFRSRELASAEVDPLALAVLNALTDSIAVLNLSGMIVVVNDSWRRFAAANGADPASCLGTSYLAVCDRAAEGGGEEGAETAATMAREIRGLLAGGSGTFSIEYPCHSPSEQRWFRVTGAPFAWTGCRHVVVSHHDITQRKLSESALRTSEEKWRTLFEILPVGVSVIDERGRVVTSNPALHKILHLSPSDLDAGAHRQRSYLHRDGTPFSGDEIPSARAIREQRIVQEVEIGVDLEDGSRIWTSVGAAPLPLPGARAVVVTSDVTPRIQAQEELRQAKAAVDEANGALRRALEQEQILARTDSLTGLHNRRYFYDLALHELAVAERYRHPLSVVLFDIDRFKEVNDTAGHEAGDEVLRRVARAATQAVRESDILARHGGEELILLLPHSGLYEAFLAAERVRLAIAEVRVETEAGSIGVTASAGIAETKWTGESLDQLITLADRALYAAKVKGRNTTVVSTPNGPALPAQLTSREPATA